MHIVSHIKTPNNFNMQPERIATITEVTTKGKRAYRLDLGNDEKGKRVTHDYHSRDSAETFKKICEEAWAKGLPTPIPDLGLPTPQSAASIIKVKNRSGSVTHRVSFSITGGKRYHRGFDKPQLRHLIRASPWRPPPQTRNKCQDAST
jgi:hypothetical protein